MRVLLINGGPHKDGSTNTGLMEVARALNENGIDTDIKWLGNQAIHGCIGCGACRNTGKCALNKIAARWLTKAMVQRFFYL